LVPNEGGGKPLRECVKFGARCEVVLGPGSLGGG